MANKRIFYALQQVLIGDGEATETSTALKGVQSVGLSSTTNVESFSAFGSIAATTILQDLDLEITIENGLGSDWTNALGAAGYGSFDSAFFDTKRTVTLEYLSDSTTSANVTKLITLEAILTSYSIQMGTDGPATESITFQNAGTSVFSAGVDGSALSAQANAKLCSVITRPRFTNFSYTPYSDCCDSSTIGAKTAFGNLQSFSANFDVGSEKISVLGQSMPIHKFATFPAEVSAELEYHLDPTGGIGGLNSGAITGNSLNDVCYDLEIDMPGNKYEMDSMRQAGMSRSGGDVGGGNVTISESYTGFNTFKYTGT